jgi:hypothetical protein
LHRNGERPKQTQQANLTGHRSVFYRIGDLQRIGYGEPHHPTGSKKAFAKQHFKVKEV